MSNSKTFYVPATDRYGTMPYNRCGRSGLKLPAISLGLWHNFGGSDQFENCRAIVRTAFDRGVTHFDLANNYGPPAGSAEETFGSILRYDFAAWRDELVISTKAGYDMWEGPYGDFGSKKYLVASLNQSLRRMNLEYVDIFYHHRFDPETPLEETMSALDLIVRQGKALYVGISNYNAEQTQRAVDIMKQLGTPLLIHQPRYSMYDRTPETGNLLPTLETAGMGAIAYSPLAQGLLTDRYLKGVPSDSRAAKSVFLKANDISEALLNRTIALNNIAIERGQSLAQMAIAWLLKDKRVTSVLVGASSVAQLNNNLDAVKNLHFTANELQKIETILQSK